MSFDGAGPTHPSNSLSVDSALLSRCLALWRCRPSIPNGGVSQAIATSAKVGPVARLLLVALDFGNLCGSKFGLVVPARVGLWPTFSTVLFD